jgi:hypothetical protein
MTGPKTGGQVTSAKVVNGACARRTFAFRDSVSVTADRVPLYKLLRLTLLTVLSPASAGLSICR